MDAKEQKVGESENGTVTGQSLSTRPAKTHQDFWKARVLRRPYVTRTGARGTPPEFSVRMRHLGRDVWFNLATANVVAAAAKARDIYVSLVSAGWDATLAKYKPDPLRSADVATLGQFLEDLNARGPLKPITVRRYAVKLRKIVGDIAKVDAGLRGKAKRRKYDYASGGRAEWLEKVHAVTLDTLTPDSVGAWRNSYVGRAGSDPVARKSAERSAASIIRCARALFSPDVVSALRVNLPSNPFAGVKLKDPGPQRYRSDVNPTWLLAAAHRELRGSAPQVYLALFLCLWPGLRRKEADLLLWEQVDLRHGTIDVRRTIYFEPKTEESQRVIDISDDAVEVLRRFKRTSTSEFVLEGNDARPDSTYDYYRCDSTWRQLIMWLKGKGVRHQKAVHMLRKESGSLIAAAYGIEAARQHLGHRDIRTTSAHYVEKRKRVEVSLPVGDLTLGDAETG